MKLFVPGRLCLVGEHSDWAAHYRRRDPAIPPGACLVSGTDQGIHGEAAPRDGEVVIESRLPDGRREGPLRVALDPRALEEAIAAGGFFRYALGVVHALLPRLQGRGLHLRLASDLPVQKGLSSSAAICVLVARAFGRLYGLDLSRREEIELAYRGERATGSECGRMDQVCAYGRRVTFLHFDQEEMEVEVVEPGASFSFLVVDLRRGKDTPRILKDLNACFPDTPGGVAAAVRRSLGPENVRNVALARGALERGDAASLGALLSHAQERFDAQVAPACPELDSPRLHEVLAHPAVGELAFGGKGVGSQGDGSAQLLARDPEARDALAARLERDLGVACLPLTIAPDEGTAA